MKCRRSEELWGDYVEGTLPGPLRNDLDEHLEICQDCSSLFARFREVLAILYAAPRPQPGPDLVERILATTRPRLTGGVKRRSAGVRPLVLLSRESWALWAAAAAFLIVLFFRPPQLLSNLGGRVSRVGRQAYSLGVRLYEGSERLIDELNVLRMTVGVAFEDRLDRLNERLKGLEEARRKSEADSDKTSGISPLSSQSARDATPTLDSPRSLT